MPLLCARPPQLNEQAAQRRAEEQQIKREVMLTRMHEAEVERQEQERRVRGREGGGARAHACTYARTHTHTTHVHAHMHMHTHARTCGAPRTGARCA